MTTDGRQLMNSELMRYYPTFGDFLATQPTYDDIYKNLNIDPIVSMNLAKFTLNLPVIQRNEIDSYDIPPGWELEFNECEPEYRQAIIYVNSQIRLGKIVFPKKENLFRAFRLTPLNTIKVIIIGQDPYHSIDTETGEPVASGLSFSCAGRGIQPSLNNIFKELANSFGRAPSSGNLEHWALQGVLLINKCLTVNKGEAKSHGDAWKFFVFKLLNIILEKIPFCFLCLWGNVAQKLVDGRDKLTFNSSRVMVLKGGHPSGLNQTNPFVGCGHFVTINNILMANGYAPIDWIGS
jgi:uracil-DNA glycosylase